MNYTCVDFCEAALIKGLINSAESQNTRNILRCTRTAGDFDVVIVSLQR